MSRVAILRGTDPIEMTMRALDMIEAAGLLETKKPFLVKPNYIMARHPSTGVTTDARVVEGVVKFLRERNVKEIVIGEGTGWGNTLEAFEVAGINAVAERWGVRTLDLNHDKMVEVLPPTPLALRKVSVSKTAFESFIISVPKLKIHASATVTLSLKNMMGALAYKGTMHNGQLHRNIADLASVLKPSIAVIDGIVAGESHETSTRPVNMNLVIAGTDPVATDAVGTAIMGIAPDSVKHLCFAAEKQLGTYTLKEITVLGEPVERVKRRFDR